MFFRKSVSLLLLTTALTSLPFHAASAQSMEEMKAIIAALTKRVEQLEAKQAAEENTAEVLVSNRSAVKKPDPKTPIITKFDPAMAIGTADGRYEFNMRGRVYMDTSFASDRDGTMDLQATEMRAARIGIQGKAGKAAKYKLEADFAGDKVAIKDAYIQLKNSMGSWTFGQSKTPNSLEEETSSLYNTFMERAAFTDAFGLTRMVGVRYGTGGDSWSFNAGLFRGTSSSTDEDEGEVFAARVTYGQKMAGGTWMLGGSARFRNVGGGSALRYRQKAFAHLSNRFLATDRIASKDSLYGLEGAAQMGAFHVASEWAFLRAQDGGATGDANFNGGYFEAGWFITGEHSPLTLSKGVWSRPKIKKPVQNGGIGAWQVAAKYDRIDLTDDGVFGGEQNTYVLGVNWYLNRYSRFTVNYNHSDIARAFGVSANGADGANSVNALSLRIQADW